MLCFRISLFPSGLSLFCAGSTAEKVRCAFGLCDLDRDGYVSWSEMYDYLLTVYNMLYELSREAFELAGCSSEEMARLTTDRAFSDAWGDNDRLSYWQFQKWYIKGLEEFELLADTSSLAAGGAGTTDDTPFTITTAQHMLGLIPYSGAFLVQYFSDATDEEGCLSRALFQSSMSKLIRRHYIQLSVPDRVRVDALISAIYDAYDTRLDGLVDHRELICGLLLFAGGEDTSKAIAAFSLFATPQTSDPELYELPDCISETEMVVCVGAILRIIASFDSSVIADTTPEDAAVELTVAALSSPTSQADARSLSVIGFISTFERILLPFGSPFSRDLPPSGTREGSEYGQDEQQQNGYDSQPKQNPSPVANPVITEIRKAQAQIGLVAYSADDLMETLGEWCNGDGYISHGSWLAVVRLLKLLNKASEADIESAKMLASRIFFAMDSLRQGAIPLSTLVVGISALCDSLPTERLMVIFTLLDSDNDGLINTDELEAYYYANLLVMSICSPTVGAAVHRAVGDRLTALASAATDRALAELGVVRSEQGSVSFNMLVQVHDSAKAFAKASPWHAGDQS
jgi:Ca2+-binding EF-hand superfamily protein